ncbi:MAG: DUF1800 domain-containing protein [Acidimicrobiia bacterium]
MPDETAPASTTARALEPSSERTEGTPGFAAPVPQRDQTDRAPVRPGAPERPRTVSRRAVLGLPALGALLAACTDWPTTGPSATTTTAKPTTSLFTTTTAKPTTTTAKPTTTTAKPTTTTAGTTTTAKPTTTTAKPTTTTAGTTTTTAGPAPIGLNLDSEAGRRLLAGRATFGSTPAVIDRMQAIGAVGWIDEQLNLKRADGTALGDAESRMAGNSYLNASISTLHGLDGTDGLWTYRLEFEHAALLRAVYSERQLYEVMVHFWANHFSTPLIVSDFGTHPLRPLHVRDVIRPNAFGKFKDLLLAHCQHPVMLYYLDNVGNDGRQGTMNVNFARELLELHTLGIIENKQVYVEADVKSTAKIMSGWDATAEYSTLFRWNPGLHNLEAISILGGQWTRPARSYGQGFDDGKSLLNFLATHPATAKYLAWKLVRHFITDTPDVTTPGNLVEKLAATYLANDTDIKPVLRQLFQSPEFAASSGNKFKRPNEFMFSALRASEANASGSGWNVGDWTAVPRALSPLDEPYGQTVGGWGFALGQPMDGRPTPDGWPDVQTAWLSSAAMLTRWNFAGRVARNQLTCVSEYNVGAVPLGVNAAALVPASVPSTATIRDLLTGTAARRFNFVLPAADADAIATAAGLSPTGARSTFTSAAAQTCMGLLMGHPNFMLRG